jgi:hypothetical protein
LFRRWVEDAGNYLQRCEWPPARGGAQPPYELRSASGRRGPGALWERFDEAVAELDRVSEGRSMRAVGRAYAELADVAHELATVVERQERADGLLRAKARTRAMASRGRLSPGASASNNPSTRSAQSAAHAATIRRSGSLNVCRESTGRFSHAFRRSAARRGSATGRRRSPRGLPALGRARVAAGITLAPLGGQMEKGAPGAPAVSHPKSYRTGLEDSELGQE